MRAPAVVVLDANVWGRVVNPAAQDDFRAWFDRLLASGRDVVVPEIVDYEVRRSLLTLGHGERRWQAYEALRGALLYAPLTTAVMRRAAAVWAEARMSGRPFASDERLDGDSILIAQVQGLGEPGCALVATTNVRHIGTFVPAVPWEEVEL